MTNEEIQKHIETNCRNEHEEPMMDEQAFYEGAKWARDQMNSSNDIQNVSDRKWLVGFLQDGIHHSEIAIAPTALSAKDVVNHNNPKMLRIVSCIEQV